MKTSKENGIQAVCISTAAAASCAVAFTNIVQL